MEVGNEPLVDTETSQSLGRSMDAAPGATQYNDPSQTTAPSANIDRYCFHSYHLTIFDSNRILE